MKLSTGLRMAIQDSGLSINSLGLQSGVAQSSLHRFYRRERSMTLKNADKLAEFLEFKFDFSAKEPPKIMNKFESFRVFCQDATDNQLVAIYWKETNSDRQSFAAIARAVADGRDVDLVHSNGEGRSCETASQ